MIMNSVLDTTKFEIQWKPLSGDKKTAMVFMGQEVRGGAGKRMLLKHMLCGHLAKVPPFSPCSTPGRNI